MSIIGALPVTLTNGTTADANQVMTDFNFIASQVNTNAAPLAAPSFTGTATGVNLSLSGTLAATGNTTLGGTLTVTGAATFNNILNIAGTVQVGGGVTLGDSLVVINNLNVGGNVAMTAGYITAPATPAFLASNTGAADVSVNPGSVIIFSSTAGSGFNVGGSYNTSTSVFTAPVAGYYQINTGLSFRSSGGSTGYMEIGLFVNGTQTGNGSFGFLSIGCTPNSAGGTVTLNMTATIHLAAGDALTIQPTTNTTAAVRYATASAYFGARLVG